VSTIWQQTAQTLW